jgi:hypothetical protein
MVRQIAILVLGTAAVYFICFLPMRFLVKDAPAEVVVWAALICLAPGAAVLIAANRLSDKPAEARIISVLVTTIFRMAAALGGGTAVYELVPEVRANVYPFVAWAVLFYVATLFIETRLLYTDSSAGTKANPSGS